MDDQKFLSAMSGYLKSGNAVRVSRVSLDAKDLQQLLDLARIGVSAQGLADSLMDMVNQYFSRGPDGLLHHSFLSAEESAIAELIAAGLAVQEGNGYRLLWEKLPRIEID